MLERDEERERGLTPNSRARAIMAFVGIAKGSALYCELKVAGPQTRGGRTSWRGGRVGGIWREMLFLSVWRGIGQIPCQRRGGILM